MLGTHVSDATTEHNGLHVLAPLSVWQDGAEGTRKAVDQWLAKLVSVIAGTVARLNDHLERRRKLGVLERGILPRELITRDQQLTNTVACRTSQHVRTTSSRMTITNATSSSGGGTREGRNACRKIMRFSCERNIQFNGRWLHRRCLTWLLGCKVLQRMAVSSDRARVVREGHHTVATLLMCQCILHQLEESLFLGDSVDHQLTAEKPMPAMLAVRLTDVKELHNGGITTNLLLEEFTVTSEIGLVERESHFGVHLLESIHTLRHHRNRHPWLRKCSVLEGGGRSEVHTLGHAIV
mmetsp:Transcript_5726/g.14542  ORF Transcript_5726/g.14542 Transcript_5726/m.14542 type:complete len:295 (-) Transcript_5726:711-1595(-)